MTNHSILRQFYVIMDQILWEAHGNPGKASDALSTMMEEILLLYRQIQVYSNVSPVRSKVTLFQLSER